jgi:preprotein translocase subunit SecD
LLDGLVQSAPVIQTKIPGGIATITMGSAIEEQQKIDAINLEKALNGY